MSTKLLIVESPAKAKTIGKYLGGEYCVRSSVGHIRDLPKENNAIKIEPTGENTWSFTPTYEISEGKAKVVSELKSAVKDASEIFLASDPDREGEAIAWHLREVLAPVAKGKPFHRVTYNEITKSAVLKAVAEPRDIDMPLVDAQQARRILDRLVGYRVSPLLWKNINTPNSRTLSAGRVQSVALRLLVERQREIDSFKPETYHLMGVEAHKPGDEASFVARLARLDGKKPDIRAKDTANNVLLDLEGASLVVGELKAQPKTRHALPPFTTSTLQQAASSVLGFSPGKTMKLAQSLYEQGRITYMRSDSVNVSEQARAAAKDFVVANYGDAFYPDKPNFFKSKSSAQEAHEAIRPTDVSLTPQSAQLEPAELKLYDLIWRRFLASQMADAKTTVRTIALEPRKPGLAHTYTFTASATSIDFEGFLKVMHLSLGKKTADGEADEDSDEVARLPDVKEGEALEAIRWISEEKQTKGPSHYSEASLIKALEENGVGRPSTYAATIETLKTRTYAKTEKKKLIPLERGMLVCDWLVGNMPSLFNVGFTARMEAELDKVEEQGEPMNAMLSEFYREFLASMPAPPPPPEAEKFDLVFSLLGEVQTWKSAQKVGKRVYDDKAFFESVKEQAAAGTRPLSARQLDFLVRMAVSYADQIRDCMARLKECGLAVRMAAPRADPESVKYCFETMGRIDGLRSNPFLKSLHEQWERGRPLTVRQLHVLARAIGEKASVLEDADTVLARLASFIPGGLEPEPEDPSLPALLKMLEDVKEWRPCIKRGKRLYDDVAFVKSLNDQYAKRHTLSSRQAMALRRIVSSYREQIVDYDKRAVGLGLPGRSSERNGPTA